MISRLSSMILMDSTHFQIFSDWARIALCRKGCNELKHFVLLKDYFRIGTFWFVTPLELYIQNFQNVGEISS